MHICSDEVNAAMALIGSGGAIGYIAMKVRHVFHRVFHGKQVDIQEDGCCHDHEEHADE